MIMKTFSLKKENVERQWYVVDASDKVLGRLATKIASRIRGKDKPTFTPHTDGGDYVIVINAEKIKVTGQKFTEKNIILIHFILVGLRLELSRK
jgi:large subunit ribosomal protein L13